MTLEDKIKRLCNAYGVTGDESAIQPMVKEFLEEYCDKVETDEMGNCVGYRYSGKPNAKKIMMDAHMDQIGLIVSDITKEGFLRVVGIGVDPRMMPGNEMTVLTRSSGNLYGIGISTPPALEVGDATKSKPLTESLVDLGLPYEKVIEMVAPGDYVAFGGMVQNLGRDKLCGKAMDDRACLCTIIHALDLLKDKELEHDLVVCASVKEEVGGHGAQLRTYLDKPDLAIAIDVCHARTPDVKDPLKGHTLGNGPVLSVGTNTSPYLGERVQQLARMHNIPLQINASPAKTGTNAWTMQVIDQGCETLVISVPERYMHTPVEVLSMHDVYKTGELLASIVQDGRFFD